MYPIHDKPPLVKDFNRLKMLWEKYPQYRERTTFSSVENLLKEHESYRKDYEDVREEYECNRYDRFLIRLSWADLPYRYGTMKKILQEPELSANSYVEEFMDQFQKLDTEHQACFLFPESYISQFFVIREVCKKAESFYPVRNLFPDEEKIHYLAVFDKKNMDDVLLMYHLLYTNATEDLYGGYSLYDYSLPWYQNHLWDGDLVYRSPYLPDRIARYQGSLPYYHNPAKTVYVRRNIAHILKCGYFSSEIEFFRNLTQVIMPLFHWWYMDLALYEEKDGIKTNWRMERTRIRTRLTAEGVIKPNWKHELSLFHALRARYPDTLYQYRPDWLGRQSLDLYIPSLRTGIEYQGIQHYHPVEFFGGQEALEQRQELDRIKKEACRENQVRLIEWLYDLPPTEENVERLIENRPQFSPKKKG